MAPSVVRGLVMGWGETTSAELNSEEQAKISARAGKKGALAIGGNPRLGREADGLIKKPAIILDMGEASREQGFRMNGCR